VFHASTPVRSDGREIAVSALHRLAHLVHPVLRRDRVTGVLRLSGEAGNPLHLRREVGGGTAASQVLRQQRLELR
jgi:hypothetical protein